MTRPNEPREDAVPLDSEDRSGRFEARLLRWEAAIRRSGAKAQRAEASRERVQAARDRAEAARERAEAARSRADGLLEKLVLPDGAEMGEDRSTDDQRERLADNREAHADQRERMADDRDLVADERERIADEREVMADTREAEADERERKEMAAHPSAEEREAVSRALEERGEELRLQAAEIAERMASEAEAFADYLESRAARGDERRRLVIAETEREIAKIGRRNAARLRESAGLHDHLEHLPGFPPRDQIPDDPPEASPPGED